MEWVGLLVTRCCKLSLQRIRYCLPKEFFASVTSRDPPPGWSTRCDWRLHLWSYSQSNFGGYDSDKTQKNARLHGRVSFFGRSVFVCVATVSCQRSSVCPLIKSQTVKTVREARLLTAKFDCRRFAVALHLGEGF